MPKIVVDADAFQLRVEKGTATITFSHGLDIDELESTLAENCPSNEDEVDTPEEARKKIGEFLLDASRIVEREGFDFLEGLKTH